MIDGRIILNHSQVSLKQIQTPVYHIEMGCQLDIYDLKDEQYTLMQGECPVCLKYGHFMFDQKAFESQKQMQTKQCVELSNKLYQAPKLPYSQFCFSEFQDIFQLQQQFNKNQLIGQNYLLQNTETIQQIALERNQSFFDVVKLISNKKPLLYGILNYKLILFYDSLKIKIELELVDQTINKYMHYANSGIVKQALLHEEYIYLIVEKKKIHQLYRGNFLYCFDQLQPLCCVHQMPGYTMVGETKLFKVKDQLLMIGIHGYLNIQQEYVKGIKMIETNLISNLKYKPQITQFNDQIYLIYSKQFQNQNSNYYQQIIIEQQNNPGSDTTIQSKQKYEQKLSYTNPFDSILTCDDCIYLIQTSQLNTQATQSQFFSFNGSQSFMKTFEMKNHHTYLEVVEIPSSSQQVMTVSCKLVGLKLKCKDDDELILPGLLVINPFTKIIEIELI